MNPVLQVTLDHEPIGSITADIAKDTLHFEYEPHWLAGEGFPVSPQERDFAAALCSHIRGKALRYQDVAAELPQVRL